MENHAFINIFLDVFKKILGSAFVSSSAEPFLSNNSNKWFAHQRGCWSEAQHRAHCIGSSNAFGGLTDALPEDECNVVETEAILN